MQVRLRLRLNTAVTALSIALLIVALAVTAQRVSRAMEQNRIADGLITASFERLALSSDYIRTGSERAREQMLAKNAQVGRLLKPASERFTDSEDRKTLADLAEGQDSIGKIFQIIVANRNDGGSRWRDPELSREVEDRLLSQLNMRSYESVLLGGRLQESTTEVFDTSLRTGFACIALVLLLLGAATLVNSASLNRTIAARIGRLRDGALALGLGDLEHRIEIEGVDEFSELAGSFNEMTVKLRRSHQALETENEERRLAERGLRETAAELQAANAELAASRHEAMTLLDDALAARLQAEQSAAALRESEAQLSLALRSADMGAWRLDLASQTRHFDDQVCSCLGIDPAGFRGTAGEFNAAVHPEDRDGLREAMERTLASGTPYEVEYRAVWPDGSIRHIASRGRLALDAAGNPLRLDGLVWDITGEKRAEEALRQAKLLAEAASRTKSQFLANMSHELRTPMTGVLGMLELALRSPSDSQQQDYIETAHRSGSSLLRILNDILDLTKVEAGKFVLDEKPFDVRACVSEAVDVLMPEARRKGLELGFSLAADLPVQVCGDQVRLRQVLTNLVGNAVKFTDEGMVEVTVRGAGGEPDAPGGGLRVSFCVRDTGIGVPEEKQHLLFKPFSQVDDSNTRSYGGTGLGLAISKEIVERMGGEIGFESAEHRGSSFSFTIPLGLAGSPAGAAVVPAERPAISYGAKKGGRLLIAEDDPTIRQVLGGMLETVGYQLDFAEDGRRAVEMWQERRYDVILMDVQMPRLDGFQATRAIREQELLQGGHLPIIAMTAHAMKEDEQRCIAAGMDAYISKPINFKECLQKVSEQMALHNQRPG